MLINYLIIIELIKIKYKIKKFKNFEQQNWNNNIKKFAFENHQSIENQKLFTKNTFFKCLATTLK